MSKSRTRKPEVDIFTARVPASLLSKVDEICRTQGKSRNQAVIESLSQFVEVDGDYVGMRKHFQMSLEYKLEEKISRIERLNRQYFTLIIKYPHHHPQFDLRQGNACHKRRFRGYGYGRYKAISYAEETS